MKPYEQHRHLAHERVGFLVVTVSTSRFEQSSRGIEYTDESGDTAERVIKKGGHKVAKRELISDDARQIRRVLQEGLKSEGVDVVLFTGGTGVSPTDVTTETVRPTLEKEIEGFGELLRSVSYEKIGFPAILSRATAGIAQKKLVMCLPGSPDGVKTALDLFMKDIPHVVHVAAGKH